jgi:hypothetical protein
VYYTGDAVTFPAGKYNLDDRVVFYYTERNGYRMPNYHRLDLDATRQLKKRGRFTSELTFSLYNAYGRENAFTINFRESKDNPEKRKQCKPPCSDLFPLFLTLLNFNQNEIIDLFYNTCFRSAVLFFL